MKRGAEKQISNMDGDEEEEDSEPGQGLRKADESVLAGRKMRALPKRASMANLGAAPPLSDTTPEAPPVPKIGGFSGFGSGSSSSFFSSGSTTSAFGAPAALESQPAAPAISASASGATKTFASFLGTTPGPTATPKKDEEVDPAALKYYTSLRGLNVSFLSAISKAVDQDPFTDVYEMAVHYKKFRDSVQKEFDERSRPAPAALATSAVPSSSSSLFGNGSSAAPKPPATLPTPPSSFTFGGKPIASLSVPSSGGGGGFTPAPSSSFKGFSLPSSTAAPPASPPKSSFGSTTSIPNFFSSQPKPAGDSAPNPTSAFGSSSSAFPSSSPSLFGKPEKSKTQEAAKDKDKEIKTEPKSESSNIFGGGGSFMSNPFSAPSKPATASPFGSSTLFGSSSGGSASPPKGTSSFSGFGAPKSGSFGNPVGFGFGAAAPPKTDTADAAPTTPAATTSAFAPAISGSFGGGSFSGFGAPPVVKASESGTEEEAADDSKTLPTKNHDVEGEGEEDEETMHTTRCKVFKLGKKDDGSQEWKDIGVGNLRLKKHKTTGARRVLLRNSSTGKILINFNIYKGLTPSVAAKIVTFIGHDENGASVSYRLRTQTEQTAKELTDAILREVAIAKGE